MKLILGSQSSRRSEILSYFNLPFIQIPSAFDEKTVIFTGNPQEYVQELACQKARELKPRYPNDLILTADTVVYFDGKIYNKPENEREAFQMLKKFSGKWQSVFTAVALSTPQDTFSETEETRVLFHSMSDDQIHAYLKNCAFLDKAGSYAIQKTGGIAIARIEGSYENVMGMPIQATQKILSKAGIDLWKHLNPF